MLLLSSLPFTNTDQTEHCMLGRSIFIWGILAEVRMKYQANLQVQIAMQHEIRSLKIIYLDWIHCAVVNLQKLNLRNQNSFVKDARQRSKNCVNIQYRQNNIELDIVITYYCTLIFRAKQIWQVEKCNILISCCTICT